MKSVALLIAIFSTSLSFAAIKDSKLELRHQDLIENAIFEKCALAGTVHEIASEQQVTVIDQGVRDIEYTGVYLVRVGIDQNQYDQFQVGVKSVKVDAYDHQSKNWGIINVIQVACPK